MFPRLKTVYLTVSIFDHFKNRSLNRHKIGQNIIHKTRRKPILTTLPIGTNLRHLPGWTSVSWDTTPWLTITFGRKFRVRGVMIVTSDILSYTVSIVAAQVRVSVMDTLEGRKCAIPHFEHFCWRFPHSDFPRFRRYQARKSDHESRLVYTIWMFPFSQLPFISAPSEIGIRGL